MNKRLRVMVAKTNDPYFNLATEDWIYRDLDPQCRVLYLWRNEPTIVIGRSQNAWSECDVAAVQVDGVHLVRRPSGGGAVFQDLGNTCFTFMSAKEPGVTSKQLHARNNEILIKALARLGLEAQASGRNDLVVHRDGESYKISGSAFKESPDRLFHHGTMLIQVDLGRLSSYLTPSRRKLQAKGVKSVRSRVMNLTEVVPNLEHQQFCDALIEEFFSYYGARAPLEFLDARALEQVPTLSAYHQQLRSWDWVYGKTPNFVHCLEHRFDWGTVEVHLDTDRGLIQRAQVYSDSLDPDFIEAIPQSLQGVPYRSEGAEAAREAHRQAQPESVRALLIEEFYSWLRVELLS